MCCTWHSNKAQTKFSFQTITHKIGSFSVTVLYTYGDFIGDAHCTCNGRRGELGQKRSLYFFLKCQYFVHPLLARFMVGF